MNQQLIDLAVRRGRLIERIASQRAQLDQQLQPVRKVLGVADRGIAGVRAGLACLGRHPGVVVAALALLVVVKPRRAWRFAQRGFVVWRTWRAVRDRLAAFGLR